MKRRLNIKQERKQKFKRPCYPSFTVMFEENKKINSVLKDWLDFLRKEEEEQEAEKENADPNQEGLKMIDGDPIITQEVSFQYPESEKPEEIKKESNMPQEGI